MVRFASLLVLAAFAAPSSAVAQVTSGTLAGSVVDPQGGRVPGATVVLTSESRGTRLAPVVTNTEGDFVAPNLAPDTYSVEVTVPGFKTLRRDHVPVTPGERVVVGEFRIQVGAPTETVEVTATAALLQLESGEKSFTVIPTEVASVPIAGRNFASLAALSPGVSANITTSGTASTPNRIGVGGAPNFMVDGVSVMDTGSNTQLFNLNPEAIAEVKVLANSYQAEYGRSNGLQIAAVTRGGTNSFHGSVYDLYRNSNWDPNTWANQQNGLPKTVAKQSDWGFSIGGPVGKPGHKNKLFFFYGQEFSPRTLGNTVSRFRVPTPLERQGDFSQTLDNTGALFPYIADYTTGLPCSASNTTGCFKDAGVLGKVPQNRLYGPGMAILNNLWPVPNHAQQPGENYNYQVTLPVYKTFAYQPSARLDYYVSSRLRATVKFNGVNQGRPLTPGSMPGYNDTQRISGTNWVDTYGGTVSYTFTPTIVLEATYGHSMNVLASVLQTKASNINNDGLAGLPVLYPGARSVPANYFASQKLTGSDTPFFTNDQIWLPPNFAWGSRIGCPTTSNGGVAAPCPPNLTFPGALNTNVTKDVNIILTKIKGPHTIKGGFYLNHSWKAQNINLATGALPFVGLMNFSNDVNNPLDAGFGFANAALGILDSYSQQSKFVEGSYIYNNREWFVQDNWKVNRRLTVYAGLRFVNQQPQYDEFLQSSNFFLDQWKAANAPLLYQPGCAGGTYPCSTANRQAKDPRTGQLLGPGSAVDIGLIVPGTGNVLQGVVQSGQGISKYGYTWPTLALAPRAGFAWDVTGRQRLVIRGGVGEFFDRPSGNSVQNSSSNPPYSIGTTIPTLLVQSLAQGASGLPAAVPQLIVYQYKNTQLPSNVQWNAGVQMALPWSTSLDVAYVGVHEWAVLLAGNSNSTAGNGVNINAVDFGAAFLPQNQDPTLAPSTTPGATALASNMLRSIQGYGNIYQYQQQGWSTFHSIQTSFQRRYARQLSAVLNWTWTLSNTGTTGLIQPRLQHNPDGTASVRSDWAQYVDLNKNVGTPVHQVKANLIWSPERIVVGSSALARTAAFLVNHWQLSAVETAATGTGYSVGYSYQSGGSNVNLTGSPDYAAAIRITGDPGSGCSGNQYKLFNTAAFAGPVAPSLGLESGRNYLRGCPYYFTDFALSRNFNIGHSDRIRAQIRFDAFNVFNTVIFSTVNTSVSYNNPTSQTVVNSQYDANGAILPARLQPANAGFGAVTGAFPNRSSQLQLRFFF
jgi:Carboxypeptidase regulatory-like domain/TonB-dependent Receptor Plug Domain